MNNDLVSVIVPTFNRSYCLERTIDSALAQTHSNIEVVLVDDGSTDNTRELIGRRYGSDSRVRYHFQENGGVVSARNGGFSLARGAYVALLDSDDVWFPWKLELQLACFARREDLGMVWTDMEAVDASGHRISSAYLRTMYHAWRRFTAEDLFGSGTPLSEIVKNAGGTLCSQNGAGSIRADARFYCGNIFSQMILGSLVHTSTTLLRRERLEKVKGFNPELQISGEDYDFHLRTCREGTVGFIDLPTIRYQTGMADQLTRPKYFSHVAMNCLKTIQPIIDSGTVIDLPPKVIEGRLAQVHQWIADTMLAQGDRVQGRHHLVESLRYNPWRGQPWKLLALACLPASVDRLIRRAYRKLKPGAVAAGLFLALTICLGY
jgi:glycosyltransferase involved in cell wall biosynthesis